METSIDKMKNSKLRFEILPSKTRKAFFYVAKNFNWLNDYGLYLAGGTALALQVGHRQSVDLDFFTKKSFFDNKAIERKLIKSNQWEMTYLEDGTIYGKLISAKMSLIAYPFFIPAKPFLQLGEIKILSKEDIAVMKIIAISQRGRKRDFFDMYWYFNNCEPLYDVLARVKKQYPHQKHNMHHIIKSLVYFADAEKDPMPKIYFRATWKEVKIFFEKEILKITKDVMNLKM
jgi:predicted nucleotidyltransferase component of viral defense system